jgi:nucleotide sugar dehydrogenase
MELGIIGLGKLGFPLALVFAKAGFKVKGVDISKERITEITSHRTFPEPQVNNYLEKYGMNLSVSTEYETLRNCEAIIVITQSPSFPSGKIQSEWIENAVNKLHNVNPECLAIVSSNTPVGTTDKISKTHSRICFSPEFVAIGSVIRDFENPVYGIVGAYHKEDAELVIKIWRKVHNKPIFIVRPTEAEMIKLLHNFNCSLGITFANAVGEFCEKFEVDSKIVLDMLYKDRRDFKKGLGFMGACFPHAVEYFKAVSHEKNIVSLAKFADLLVDLNSYTIEKYLRIIESYNSKKIGILGIAYKAGTPYTFESQSLKIAEKLAQAGYEVRVYDPLVKLDYEKIKFCPTADECLKKSDVIFIGTINYADIKTDKAIVNPWR